MNQVQIRQVSAKVSGSTPHVTGSWFPSGYYGHFRAKSRIDLCNDFRLLARPNPPKKFLDRHHSSARAHLFSNHDNRFRFECDPLVRNTQSGFGRRKVHTRAQGKFDPHFISWTPGKTNQESHSDTAKATPNMNECVEDLNAFFQPVGSSTLPISESSVYSTTYSHGQPDAQKCKEIHRETFQRYSDTMKRRAQLFRVERSVSVAACLLWNDNHKTNTPSKKNERANLNRSQNKPAVNTEETYRSQSLPSFKTLTITNPGPTIPSTHRRVEVDIRHQRSHSLVQKRTNNMEHLINKYM